VADGFTARFCAVPQLRDCDGTLMASTFTSLLAMTNIVHTFIARVQGLGSLRNGLRHQTPQDTESKASTFFFGSQR
jgi:hypothetical protein